MIAVSALAFGVALRLFIALAGPLAVLDRNFASGSTSCADHVPGMDAVLERFKGLDLTDRITEGMEARRAETRNPGTGSKGLGGRRPGPATPDAPNAIRTCQLNMLKAPVAKYMMGS